VTDRRGWTFTAVGFAVALVAVGIGAAVGLAVVPVVGSYLGMLLGGVAAGLAVDDRPLVETGLAAVLATLGILTAGATIGSGPGAAVSALGAVAPTTLLISVVLSFAVGAFGAHFGDDIRDGMTEPVERTPTKSMDTGLSGVPPADEETVRDEQQVRSDTDSDTSTPAEGEQEESTSMELEYE
jgi:hypothetical protein